MLADHVPHLVRLFFPGGLVAQIGDDDRLDLLRVNREIGHADPREGVAGDRNRLASPLVDVVQALQGQRTVHVDLHDDLGGGVDPFGRIVDRRRGDDIPLFGQTHRLDHHHVDGAEPPPLHLERQRRPLALDEPHLTAIDGRPELLAAHRADPRPDPPRLGEDVLHLGSSAARRTADRS